MSVNICFIIAYGTIDREKPQLKVRSSDFVLPSKRWVGFSSKVDSVTEHSEGCGFDSEVDSISELLSAYSRTFLDRFSVSVSL